jgi:hypothetical protein
VKNRSKILTGIGFVFFIWASLSGAEEKKTVPYVGSEAFQRIKTLAGVWEGTHAMGKDEKEEKVKVEYHVTSGGNAVVEKLFADTPHEMVSVYHDNKNGQLAMTHYCMLPNRPEMILTSADQNSLNMTLAENSDIDVAKETHMHSLTISFLDPNHITQKWTGFEGGKEKESTIVELSRIRK